MKYVALLLATLFLCFATAFAENSQQQRPSFFDLQFINVVDTNCHIISPEKPVLKLNSRFYNKVGSDTAPVSCKGQICWSWQTPNAGATSFFYTVYSSNLPLKITNTDKIYKELSQSINQSLSIRKDKKNMISAVKEFIQSNFESGKERKTTKERSIKKGKTHEEIMEQNITPLFHRYLSQGLHGNVEGVYPYCLASAVDLFFKAYETNRTNSLVKSFIIHKTIDPKDIDISNSPDYLTYAKILYEARFIPFTYKDKKTIKTVAKNFNKALSEMLKLKEPIWAQATLYASLLEWNEFAEVKKHFDEYIAEIKRDYDKLMNHTTKQLLQEDELLGNMKLIMDYYYFNRKNNLKLSEIADTYLRLAINKAFITSLPKEYEPQKYVNAIKEVANELLAQAKETTPIATKLNEILTANYTEKAEKDFELPSEKKRKKMIIALAILGIAVVILIAGILIWRKRNDKKNLL